jgi:hypothetical protein
MLITTRKTPILLRAFAMGVLALAVALLSVQMRGKQFPLELVRRETLKHTVVAPTWRQAIVPGRNVLWCGTFQLAWNELMEQAGGPLHMRPEYADAHWLNQARLTVDGFPPGSTFVRASSVTNPEAIYRELREDMDGVRPYALGRARKSMPGAMQGASAYAYMRTSMQFPAPYNRLRRSLRFKGEKVKAFGYLREDRADAMKDQTLLLDYRGQDNFVVELSTHEQHTRVILAKVPPETTLQTTVQAVLERTENGTPGPAPAELRVPMMNFEVDHRFAAIEGRQVDGIGPFLLAGQGIRFRLDESGVALESAAEMAVGSDRGPADMEPPVCVFDKPFLLLLKRPGEHPPYFVFWVDNAELLIESE